MSIGLYSIIVAFVSIARPVEFSPASQREEPPVSRVCRAPGKNEGTRTRSVTASGREIYARLSHMIQVIIIYARLQRLPRGEQQDINSRHSFPKRASPDNMENAHQRDLIKPERSTCSCTALISHLLQEMSCYYILSPHN